MKVVIAIDSFKGSLSSMEAGLAAREGVLKTHPDAEVIVKPLADGGEGTTVSLIEGLGGTRINLTVTGPMGQPGDCFYGILPESHTAIMEMASAAGITLVPPEQRNPLLATTFGVGEMILHAIENGCRNFIIGIGGSATNDSGIGMLKALGFEFLDQNGNDVGEGAQALSKIALINADNVNSNIYNCNFKIACDVTNPLCGENGATYIYGPQKGITEDQKEKVDQAMAHFAQVTTQYLRKRLESDCTNVITDCVDVVTDYANFPGAGAAGGLGFAFLSYLNAALTPGVALILDAINLENNLKDADIVITGEGQLDGQTAMGKAPVGVARLAKKVSDERCAKHGSTRTNDTAIQVLAFAGAVTPEAIACNAAGIDAFFPIVRGITTLEQAMNPENASANLTAAVEQVFRLL